MQLKLWTGPQQGDDIKQKPGLCPERQSRFGSGGGQDYSRIACHLQVLVHQLLCLGVPRPRPVARDALHGQHSGEMGHAACLPPVMRWGLSNSMDSQLGHDTDLPRQAGPMPANANAHASPRTREQVRCTHPDVSCAHHSHYWLGSRLLPRLPEPPVRRQEGMRDA